MPWFAYVMIALLVFNPLLTIAMIGRSRAPLGPSDAIAALVVSSLMICGVLALAQA